MDMEVTANTSGGTFQKRNRKMAAVRARDGTTYMVPVDSKGYVPQDALYEHFLDNTKWSGKGRERNPVADLRTTADRLHSPKDPSGFTPEELVATGWWTAVNESDIMGVDDSTSSYFAEIESVKPSMRSSMGKIAIIVPEDRQDFVVKTLQDNFTAAELKRMTAKTGLVVMEGNPGKGADGCYYSRQQGVDTPTVIIRNSSGEDTLTHEMIHHARYSDSARAGIARTPFPLDDDGRALPVPSGLYPTLINLEEAATVAESTSRTREKTTNLGYYTVLRSDKGAQELYDEDRAFLTKGKPVRGKRAVDRVNSDFEETNISNLKYKKGGKAPRESVAQMRKAGTLPKKTAKKTTPKPAAAKKAAKPRSTASKKAPSGGKRR